MRRRSQMLANGLGVNLNLPTEQQSQTLSPFVFSSKNSFLVKSQSIELKSNEAPTPKIKKSNTLDHVVEDSLEEDNADHSAP